jgi:hypothetical protein
MSIGQPRELDDAPKGIWLLATAVQAEQARQEDMPAPPPVRVGDRYPHIHGVTFPAERTETKIEDIHFWARDCAPCKWKPRQ